MLIPKLESWDSLCHLSSPTCSILDQSTSWVFITTFWVSLHERWTNGHPAYSRQCGFLLPIWQSPVWKINLLQIKELKKSSSAFYFCSFNLLSQFMIGRALNLWAQLTCIPCCCHHGPLRLQIYHSGWLSVLQSWRQGSLISCLVYAFVSFQLYVQ